MYLFHINFFKDTPKNMGYLGKVKTKGKYLVDSESTLMQIDGVGREVIGLLLKCDVKQYNAMVKNNSNTVTFKPIKVRYNNKTITAKTPFRKDYGAGMYQLAPSVLPKVLRGEYEIHNSTD